MPAGSAPGEYRGGGRRSGHPNNTPAHRTVREILASLDHDPIVAMVRQAQDEETAPEIRARLNTDLSCFLYPKLKSIEVKADLTDASDFLMVREMLAAYRAWRREQGLPQIGALPDTPPTEPFTEDSPESKTVPSPAS